MELVLEEGLMAGLSGLFGTYIIMRLAACFLCRKQKSRLVRILPCMGSFIIISAGHYLSDSLWVIIGCHFVAIVLMTAAYKDDKEKMVLYLVNAALVVMGVQILMALLMKNTGKGGAIKYDEQLMVNAVEYIAALMIGKVSHTKGDIRIPKIYWAAVVLVPVASMYVFSMLYKTGSLSTAEILFAALALLGVDYLMIVLYGALTAAYRRSLQQTLLEQQNRYYSEQLKSMSEAYDTIRSVKHDLKGCLNAVRFLAEQGMIREIVRYVERVNGSPGFNVKYVDTGNIMIDGILNFEKQQAVNAGVKMEFEKIVVMQKMDYDEFDMSILLGNLLDNAISAAQPLGDAGYVKVRLEQKMNVLRIVVSNPYRHALRCDHTGGLLTTKRDIRNHGIGLNNVKKIVEQYKGSIHFYTEDQIFRVEVVLRS